MEIILKNIKDKKHITIIETKHFIEKTERKWLIMINKHIDYKYDSEADTIFIKIEDYTHEESIQLNNNVIMDLNKEKQFIGLEILSASHVLKTTKSSLEKMTDIVLYLKVTDYEIFVNAIFTLPGSNHEEIKVTNASILNKINIPKLDINLVTA